FAGCSAFAENMVITSGKGNCPVADEIAMSRISKILGLETDEIKKMKKDKLLYFNAFLLISILIISLCYNM
ncbi:MAG: hypothetical protein P1P88_12415, partial [Bacteroidales bacterium]|nr:hypothetical protein [Bacteroidales bacterium]